MGRPRMAPQQTKLAKFNYSPFKRFSGTLHRQKAKRQPRRLISLLPMQMVQPPGEAVYLPQAVWDIISCLQFGGHMSIFLLISLPIEVSSTQNTYSMHSYNYRGAMKSPLNHYTWISDHISIPHSGSNRIQMRRRRGLRLCRMMLGRSWRKQHCYAQETKGRYLVRVVLWI